MKTYTITATADQMNLLTKSLSHLIRLYDKEAKDNPYNQEIVDRCMRKAVEIDQLAMSFGLFYENGGTKKF